MTQEVTATATLKDDDGKKTGERSVTVKYNFGKDLDDAAKKFGADIVFSNFRQSAVISLQSLIRAQLAAGKKDDEIQKKVSEWKPGVKTVTRKSPVDKVKDLLAGKSKEEIAEILKAATSE